MAEAAAGKASVLGASLPRLDAADKASGRARYADDLHLPCMLHARAPGQARSPHAHARILGYRLDAARAIPGVKAILCGTDLTGPRGGGIVKDESMVARGKVRYVGEPVAAVAAVDAETAQRALAAIEVDYEPLPTVLSIDEALADGAPLLHEDFASYVKTIEGGGGGNVVFESSVTEGDVERAFAECDVVVEGTWNTQAQHHGLPGNQRLRRRRRCDRPHHAACHLPVGTSPAAARRRRNPRGEADVAHPGAIATRGRRRLQRVASIRRTSD